MPIHALPERYRTDTGQIDTAKLRSDISIVEVASLLTRLKPSGDEMKGLCPLHEEHTPSFFVNERKGLFHCFGCRRSGDVIELVQAIGGRTFVESCEWLVASEATCPPKVQRSARDAMHKRQANLYRAKHEWRDAAPIAGTLAETYLALRGIHGPVPHCIRFGRVPRFWDDDGNAGPRHPAMIAAAQDVDGSVVGISRTFLEHSGRKSRQGEPRLSLGQIRGCALRLGPVRPEIMLATATEDALALVRMFPGATVWSAFGDANLAHVALPSVVRRVILCGDADTPGRAAVAMAETSFLERRLEVDTLFPAGGCKDFNEEWLLRA